MTGSTRKGQSAGTIVSTFLGGALVGAGVMFFLDPARGRRRRIGFRDQLGANMRRQSHALARLGRRARANIYGFSQRTIRRESPNNPSPDDITLKHRVESELYRDPHVPHGSILIDTYEGRVTLRGELPRPEIIQLVMESVKQVHGVREVRSFLHLPHTIAPNKAQAFHHE